MTLFVEDPIKMSSEARLTEIGVIMARGYLRLKNSQKALDVSLQDSAPCVSTAVNCNGAETVKEAV